MRNKFKYKPDSNISGKFKYKPDSNTRCKFKYKPDSSNQSPFSNCTICFIHILPAPLYTVVIARVASLCTFRNSLWLLVQPLMHKNFIVCSKSFSSYGLLELTEQVKNA